MKNSTTQADETPWKPTPADLDAARGRLLPDILSPAVSVLFVGINPSLYSAAVGHHFARPGNRFWKALHQSGCTDRLLSPFEDHLMPQYGFGMTNVAARATARADELDDEEIVRGARLLEDKAAHFGIRCVTFLGVTAYRTAFREPRAAIGNQDRCIGDARVWVLPNPSGLNAHYQLPRLAQLFAQMHSGLR